MDKKDKSSKKMIENIKKSFHILSDIIYYLTVFIFLISQLISSYLCAKYPIIETIYSDSIIFYSKYMIYILIAVIILKIDKFNYKETLFGILIILISKVSAIHGSNDDLYIACLLIIASCKIYAFNIISYFTIIRSFIVMSTVLLSLTGQIENFVYVTGGRTRHFLGFIWTTFSPIHVLFITLSILILKRNIKWIDLLVLSLINIWFYTQTKTRFAFIISMAVLLFFMIFKDKLEKITELKPIKIILIFIPFISAIFIFILTYMYKYESTFIIKINNLLSSRLKLGYNAYLNYGITLFGSNIAWKGSTIFDLNPGDYNFVDSSYLNILYSYGIITLIMILTIFSYIMYKSIKEKKYKISWVLFFSLIFAITEPELMWIHFCPFSLICFTNLETKKQQEHNNYVKKKS